MIQINDFYSDTSKIRRLVGWESRTSLKDGLSQTVSFYRQNKQYYW